MTAHLNDSDREALRLAHELREGLRQTLQAGGAGVPAVSPFVDAGGRPSALVRMDAEAARALMAMMNEYRALLAERHRPPVHEFIPQHDHLVTAHPAPGQSMAPVYR